MHNERIAIAQGPNQCRALIAPGVYTDVIKVVDLPNIGCRFLFCQSGWLPVGISLLDSTVYRTVCILKLGPICKLSAAKESTMLWNRRKLDNSNDRHG